MVKKQGVKISTIDSTHNPALTRMYFSNGGEIIGRFCILFSQLLMLGVIIIISASFGALAASKLPIPAIFNEFGIADGAFRAITVVIASCGVIFSLVFVIPTLIVRNIKLVKRVGIIYNTIGILFTVLLLVLSIFCYFYLPVKFNLPGIILAGGTVILVFIGSLLLWTSALQQQHRLNKALTTSILFKNNLADEEV
ncbi:hypothetical protein [Spiroplasma chrysopicola]|uniref:Transmembrane protein n=1 Tax=Spiroplasma chrysopicola DF-1 TaxID=1276227 RepID=R4UHR1_9MOLU|nr:hypothetical protein [Spiroplasma chrysopicola]AGM24866.1 hypothetical protein SCHRY_v1c02810 [Spiroplasma chrysopicola DF-1]